MTMTHMRPVVAVLMATVLVQVACGDEAAKTASSDVQDVSQTRPEETRVIEEIFDFFVDNGPVEYIPQEGEFLWECSTNGALHHPVCGRLSRWLEMRGSRY
jgi:hypothetical protein